MDRAAARGAGGRPARRPIRAASPATGLTTQSYMQIWQNEGASTSRPAGLPRPAVTRMSSWRDRLAGRRARHRDGAAVLGPGGLGVTRIVRPLLAVADGLDTVRGDAERDQIVLDRGRAPVAESEVVLPRAALVAVTLDGHGLRAVGLQVVGPGLDGGARGGLQVRLVGVEEHAIAETRHDAVGPAPALVVDRASAALAAAGGRATTFAGAFARSQQQHGHEHAGNLVQSHSSPSLSESKKSKIKSELRAI